MKSDYHWIALTNICKKLNTKICFRESNLSPPDRDLTRTEASHDVAEFPDQLCDTRAPRYHCPPRLQDQVHLENVKSKN